MNKIEEQQIRNLVEQIKDNASCILSLLGGNELVVSDVACTEHVVSHDVRRSNASGETSTEPSATAVDGALGKIIDVKESCSHGIRSRIKSFRTGKYYCLKCELERNKMITS